MTEMSKLKIEVDTSELDVLLEKLRLANELIEKLAAKVAEVEGKVTDGDR
jgi:hypothetical protein